MFARLGAEVTASDISPEMVGFAERLAARHGIRLATAVGAAEHINVEPGSFDVVYCANTLHHLVEKEGFFRRVTGFLKPGGIFCSWDPVKYNPVIEVYRRIATKVRTDDESPLGIADLRLLRKHFSAVEHHHFWLLTLSLFLKYFMINRVSPNQDRYWKKIYRETESTLWWWLPLRGIDDLLLQIPVLQWLSWNVVFFATK